MTEPLHPDSFTPDDLDPDLAVADGAFEAFAQAVVAAVLAPIAGLAGDAGAVAAMGEAGVGDAGVGDAGVGEAGMGEAGGGTGGSVIAGEGGDAIYTMPDGSVSFAGSGIDGTSYSFDVT
ncbi:MAG: hypothetical protein ACT4RN_03265 [Pseudonocardia sp.]